MRQTVTISVQPGIVRIGSLSHNESIEITTHASAMAHVRHILSAIEDAWPVCPDCHGTGSDDIFDRSCISCRGMGRLNAVVAR